MAATVQIRSYHGSSPDAGTDIAAGSIRYKMADNDTVDAVTPIPIPVAGTEYSWIKHFKFYCSVAPSNAINNCKFYTDGANGLGTAVALNVKIATYLDPIANANTVLTGTASAFTYTSGSALTVPGSIGAATGAITTDYIVTQMSVGSTATQGTTPSETLTFQYDES